MCLTDLAHEASLFNVQTQDGYAQHGLAGQHDLVLPDGICDRVEGLEVVSAVDLDHKVEMVPPHIEIDPSARQPPHHLSARWREPIATTQSSEVELTE